MATAEQVHNNFPLLEEDDIHVVDSSEMKKALRATILGNFMEWFDIGVYAYLSASLTAVFFPFGEPWSKLAFFATFAVTFIVRPLGGLILGPMGDKVGRKKVLAFTIIMMSFGTFLIGCIPSYNSWGMLAPITLILLKFVQGFSTGGEYAGAVTFIAEYAPDKRRGFWASFLDMGSYIGFAFAAALATIIELMLTPEQMISFGWRICFWVALPLGLIGMYMRSHINESAAFEATLDEDGGNDAEKRTMGQSLKHIFKEFWPQLLIGSALVMCAQVIGYALTSFMPTYLTSVLGYDTMHGNALLVPVLIGLSLALPLMGLLSDRIGRKPVMMTGAVIAFLGAIPSFWLMMQGSVPSTLAGLALMAVMLLFQASIQPSTLPSLFPTKTRYTAMGVMFNVAVALFGSTTSFVVTALQSWWKTDYAGAYYIMFACVVGLIGMFFLKETAGQNLLGSMPAVETEKEATELVETQLENDNVDTSTMPIPQVRIDKAAEKLETGEIPVTSASSSAHGSTAEGSVASDR
ncbi:MAG: MFS transporter [Rothia sp. (in: high G+C Gram-positive bacteria)]|nr:MFS transporter [Rothia sp. (in: high G+C Gram-positive bacteria)]